MPYSAEAQQYFDRLILEIPTASKTLIAALIDGLVADGVWTKLPALYATSGYDSFAGRTNLTQSSYELEVMGAPSFGLDHSGYRGTGSTDDYLNTQLRSSAAFSQDSASMGVFLTAGPGAGVDSGGVMGTTQAPTFVFDEIWPHYTDNKMYWAANGNLDQAGVAGIGTGMFSWTRSGANTNLAYRNGVLDASKADASIGFGSAGTAIRILQASAVAAGSTVKVGAAWISNTALTAPEQLAIYNRLNTYLTAVSGLTGVEVPVVAGAIASTLIDDGLLNGTPGGTKMASGNLISVYTVSTDELLTDGVWKKRTSSDNGATWSAATTFYTPADTDAFSCADVEITKLADDSLIVSGSQFARVDGNAHFCGVMLGNSTGTAWGSLIPITDSIFTTWNYTTGKVIQLGSGRLMLPFYGKATGDTWGSVGVIFSDDGGLTWGNDVLCAVGGTTHEYNESTCAILGSGRIVHVMRREEHGAVTKGYSMVYSDDDGETWSSPVDISNSVQIRVGKPALLALGGNVLFMLARFGLETGSRWLMSTDGGFVWGPATPIGPPGLFYFYGSAFLLSPTKIGAVVSLMRTTDDAYLVYRDFDYTEASDPEPDPVVIPSIATTPDDPGRKGPKKKRQKRPLDVQGTTEGLWVGRPAYRIPADRQPSAQQAALPAPQPKEARVPVSGKTLLEMSQKLAGPDEDEQDMEILRRMGAFD